MTSRQRRPSAGAAPQRPAFAVDLAAARTRLRAVIEPQALESGYDLEDLTVRRMGRRHVVQVTVDRDGGVALDDVADLARDLSAAIDAAEAAGGEVIAGEYQLEVSSPGTDRPLRLPRHWRRNAGRLVRVKADGHTVLGRVVDADDAGVRLNVDGTVHHYDYADLGPGHVEIEFNRLDEITDEDMVDFGGADDGEDTDTADPDDFAGGDDEEEEDER